MKSNSEGNTAGELTKVLKDLFVSQRLAVLSTQGQGQPYSSLVAFAEADDLRTLLFATLRSTRKFSNLTEDHRVAMLVDSRSNRESDFHNAVAVTAVGRAEEATGVDRERLMEVYLLKHPHLADFAASPGNALVRVSIDDYVVSRFQRVLSLRMPG